MIDVCLYQREKRVCSKVKRNFKPFYLMCRNPRPETRGAPAGAGELLRGWQHLRRHRGPRGQLQAEHARPQRRLRYKPSPLCLLGSCLKQLQLLLNRSHFIFFVYLYFKQEDPQKAEIFYNQDKEKASFF